MKNMTNTEILKKAIEKYFVKEDGTVWNRKTWHQLKPALDNKGYQYISFYLGGGKSRKLKVHRLVAQHWIPNPDDLPHINHKDGNRANNTVDNLEWCTAQYNVSDGFKRGRIVWNKGIKSKSQILRLCRKYPRQMFWLLTTNDFAFAKAFWGEGDKAINYDFDQPSFEYHFDGEMSFKPRWQEKLQQMVLEEDPIKYLEQFI